MSKTPVIEVNRAGTQNKASASPTKKLGERLGNVENVTQAVLWVGLISLVAIVVAVSAMVLDQFHFNNQTYHDQSDKNNAEIEELNTRTDALQTQLNQTAKPTSP